MRTKNYIVEPLMDEVVSQIASDYGVSNAKILSYNRSYELVDARCVIVKVLDNLNYPKKTIRDTINRTDATTVRNLFKRLEARPDLKLSVEKYTEYFKGKLE